MTDQQMELGFNGIRIARTRRERRVTRAHWWFTQMRSIVDRAFEPASDPRPEQIWLPGGRREIQI